MSKTVSTLALLSALTLTAPAWAAEKAAEKPAEKAAVEKAAAEKEKPATPTTAPAKADLNNAAAGEYAIDASHTNVFFRVSHLGFSGYMGRFNKIEGKVVLDPKDLTKTSLDVTIDAASIDVNHEKLEGELREKEVLDAAAFPSITFKSTKMEQKDASHGTITGDLTLHGVTKPVTLDVTLNGAGVHPMSQKPTLGFSATGMLKRSDFGVAKWLPMVGDSVQLIIETEMQKS
ncbi:MAG: polyisoprenoid-binding protein [Alphaproteobacteria bacterium]|nr:polyisoprenoid-binding protein [Alphaproteobacteria bacterium]